MSQILCSIHNCKQPIYHAENLCILHCEKSSYEPFSQKYNVMIQDFYKALMTYIATCSHNQYNPIKPTNVDDLGSYLPHVTIDQIAESFRDPSSDIARIIRNYLEDRLFIFNKVHFPYTKKHDQFSYFSIIKNCKKIHFNQCTFNANLPLEGIEYYLFYDECSFLTSWSINNNSILENESNVLYQACTFTDNVSIYTPDGSKPYIIGTSLFNDCAFKKYLELDNTIFKNPIFNNASDHENPINIKKLSINKCVFEDKFILNKLKSDSLKIEDTEFKSKVELKSGYIKNTKISNTNFEGIFDSFGTNYTKFNCYKSIFSDFVGFEQCVFSISEATPVPTFQYTTFLNLTSFRKAKFHSGLCLEEANFKEPPNFLNIELESNNPKVVQTSRETLRIIKYSFDNLGNQIEANKYFVLEMQKHQQDLLQNKTKQNIGERWALFFNKKISNFGQSYIRPICIYVVLGLIYLLLTQGHKKNYLYEIYPPINGILSGISEFLNALALSILPFKSFLRPGMEFLSLIFYIAFAILTWQIITSIKRVTKR